MSDSFNPISEGHHASPVAGCSVGVLFDGPALKQIRYGDEACVSLFECLDFRNIGNCIISFGDIRFQPCIFAIGFQHTDLATARYILDRVNSAYFIYGGGIPMSSARKALCMSDFHLKDDSELTALHKLGSVLYQEVTTVCGQRCDELPLCPYGLIENGVIMTQEETLFSLVMGDHWDLRTRLRAESMEGFLRRSHNQDNSLSNPPSEDQPHV